MTAGGVGAGLRLHHQLFARRAEPEDRDMPGDQRVRIGVALQVACPSTQAPRRASSGRGPVQCAAAPGRRKSRTRPDPRRHALREALRLVPDEGIAEHGADADFARPRALAISGVSTVPASRKQVVPLRIISMQASRTDEILLLVGDGVEEDALERVEGVAFGEMVRQARPGTAGTRRAGGIRRSRDAPARPARRSSARRHSTPRHPRRRRRRRSARCRRWRWPRPRRSWRRRPW